MELRIVVLAGVAAATGWIARGVATGSPAPPAAIAAAATPAPRIVYVPAPARDDAPSEAAVDPDDDTDDGEDVGELLARVQREAPPPPPAAPHNLITGIVVDQLGGDRLAGVTVIVAGPLLDGSRAAVTDESGEFSIADLPAGSYTVTFYYLDVTQERSGVTVSSFGHTTLNTQLDERGSGEVITGPVPARTFESVLGEEGISFTGVESMDNTYVVDGIDVTGLE